LNGRRYRSREPMLVTEEGEGSALGEVHRCITQERSGKILRRVLQEREQEKMSAVSGILNWMNEPTLRAQRERLAVS